MSAENPILGTQRYFWRKWKKIQKMSSGNPILGAQRYFWAKWRKMTENRPRQYANLQKTPPHTAKSKNPENLGVARCPVQKCKKRKENKAKLLYFTIFTIKTNAFLTFLRFFHFGTRIFTKNATCWSNN